MRILPSFVRRGLISLGKSYFAPRAISRRENLPRNKSEISIHMVVGHSMLPMGLLALRSFEFHTRRRWAPLIHEDGTFTDNDRNLLLKYFPDAVIIERQQADKEATAALKKFPACCENRLKHNWFLKVFDTRHYAPYERYILLDSDIIFFRRPEAILHWIDSASEEMWLMEDNREKYSHPRFEIENTLKVKIIESANSGLDLIPKNAADLDLAERFLAECVTNVQQYEFLEQTIFGIWLSAWGQGGLLPRDEYEISWNTFHRADAVCRHYIGSAKNDALFFEGAPTFWWQSRKVGR